MRSQEATNYLLIFFEWVGTIKNASFSYLSALFVFPQNYEGIVVDMAGWSVEGKFSD